jgi:hypothetical protein
MWMNASLRSGDLSKDRKITIRDLCPTLADSESKKAEAKLHRYFEIALKIHEDQSSPAGDFDSSPPFATMRERSKPTLKT